jgi:hypothetical protein
MAGKERQRKRQNKWYRTEDGDMYAKPPPWKYIITGRDVAAIVEVEEGMNRRNQRLHVESTITSEEETPLDLKLRLVGNFKSIMARRRRFIVPLERPVILLIALRMDIVVVTFHGRFGLVLEAMVVVVGILNGIICCVELTIFCIVTLIIKLTNKILLLLKYNFFLLYIGLKEST